MSSFQENEQLQRMKTHFITGKPQKYYLQLFADQRADRQTGRKRERERERKRKREREREREKERERERESEKERERE